MSFNLFHRNFYAFFPLGLKVEDNDNSDHRDDEEKHDELFSSAKESFFFSHKMFLLALNIIL
jgi:hypothetical protein